MHFIHKSISLLRQFQVMFSASTERYLLNLLSETASLGKSCTSSGWLTKHNIAVSANNNGLSVAENGGDLETSWALDVHEEAIWALDKTLELVCLSLSLRGRIQEIDWHF